ncbi:MAG: hypothetical protein ACRYFU_21615 [Janthinobacterium lividum]
MILKILRFVFAATLAVLGPHAGGQAVTPSAGSAPTARAHANREYDSLPVLTHPEYPEYTDVEGGSF